MTEFDNRKEWYQSICYTALEQPLERLRDDQEEKLVHNLIMLFRECEKYSVISQMDINSDEECFSVDMVATKGTNISSQTFKLTKTETEKADELEMLLNNALANIDNNNVAICTLLRVLNKKMSK